MKTLLLTWALLVVALICKAQKFDVEYLRQNGPVDKCINLVVMGDGYVENEQDKFIEEARKITDYFLSCPPFLYYSDFFNVIAIKAISNESGVKHPKTSSDKDCKHAASNPDNYFGSTFDYYGIHRLVGITESKKAKRVLAENFPEYDQAIVLANSAEYGGSGGSIAVTTTNKESFDIATHEIAHSFADLADEYWAGDTYAAEKANMTRETDPDKVKWKNWYGTDKVGIYKVGTHSKTKEAWYRPHQSCKMQILDKPFCNVCTQKLVEEIKMRSNPIIAYEPLEVANTEQPIVFELIELIEPNPNTLSIEWDLDGEIIAKDIETVTVDPAELSSDEHTLTLSVIDNTGLMRLTETSTVHINRVKWTLSGTKTGISSVGESRITYSFSPNPVEDVLNVSITADIPLRATIQLINVEGVAVKSIVQNKLIESHFTEEVNMSNLPQGIYFISFNLDGNYYTEKIIKK